MTSVNDNSHGMFATLGLTSSSDGENYVIPFFRTPCIQSYAVFTRDRIRLEPM